MDYTKFSSDELKKMRETIISQKEVVVNQLNSLLEIENKIVDALKTKPDYM